MVNDRVYLSAGNCRGIFWTKVFSESEENTPQSEENIPYILAFPTKTYDPPKKSFGTMYIFSLGTSCFCGYPMLRFF